MTAPALSDVVERIEKVPPGSCLPHEPRGSSAYWNRAGSPIPTRTTSG